MARQTYSVLLLCASCILASASKNNEFVLIEKPKNSEQTSSPLDYEHVVDRFEEVQDRCRNALSAVCTGSELSYNNYDYIFETSRFTNVKMRIMNILQSESDGGDSLALKTEKKLFYNCMKLGEEDDDTKEKTLVELKYIVHRILNHLKYDDSSWQGLDNLLSLLGFGHTFYEIKVERDPENDKSNIIVLQPPPYVDTELTTDIMKRILDSSNNQANDVDDWNLWKFFEIMKINKKEIESFYKSLIKIISPMHEDKDVQHHQKKTTLGSWMESNNSYSSNAYINWTNVLSQEFKEFNFKIDHLDESLLIKNKAYFLNLYALLNSTSNNIISSYILTKMLAEQLPYVDWESYQTIRRVKKDNFCFEETKLYGASFKALHDINIEYVDRESFSRIEDMLDNILDVMNADISRSHTLSEKRKHYLKNELKYVTNNIWQKNYDSIVEKYYINYRLSHIYFLDIINYRQIIKKKELSTLRARLQSPSNQIELYSFVDLRKPRNRLLTKLLMLNMRYDVISNREINYSRYGADLAKFLYSLLNENKFADYMHDFKVDRLRVHAYPTFSAAAIKCYQPTMIQNQKHEFINQMLSTMFGMHIAYDAMLKESTHSTSVQVSERKWISSDEFFFISFMKNHCYLGSNLLDEIFSKSDIFSNVFDCNDYSDEGAVRTVGCRQQPFEVQNKNIFLV